MSTDPNPTPVRIPKLAVRNKIAVTTVHADSFHEIVQKSPQIQVDRPTSPNRQTPSVPQRTRRPTDASTRSGLSTAQQSVQKAKKKKGGVFGFLTLKEPSSSAWDEYAAQQRKNNAAKGGRNTAVGMPGILSQKLPEHVPKVNTKWDGLPDEARRKAQQQKERSKRNSNISGLSRSTYQTYRTNKSSSDGFGSPRNGSSSSLLQSQTNSSGSQWASTQTARHQDLAAAYGYRSPAPAATHPALRTERSEPASRDSGLSRTPPSSLPDIPGLDLPELAGFEAAAFITTSGEPSPKTSNMEDPIDTMLDAKPVHDAEGYHDYQATYWSSNINTAESHTDSSRLGTFADSSMISTYASRTSLELDAQAISDESESQEDWPLRAPQPSLLTSATSTSSHQPTSSTSTTGTAVYTIDSSTTAPTVTLPTFSRDTESDITRPSTAASGGTIRRDKDLEPTRSNSDTSIAPSMVPSVMSAQWALSPKERLGLGGKMRKSEVSPWDLEEPPAVGSGGQRKRASTTLKKNRLSAILGRK